ncbi:hypothetical protein [Shewanella sp. UCD-KL12]|uniref:hypothetical protein n=1 Tax=Shewanella sp. UCD-KL12 TaxID=1917163 RepID=UPI00097115EE|nr:hypothetical protein [Shewanella sp. UCD-KL12]
MQKPEREKPTSNHGEETIRYRLICWALFAKHNATEIALIPHHFILYIFRLEVEPKYGFFRGFASVMLILITASTVTGVVLSYCSLKNAEESSLNSYRMSLYQTIGSNNYSSDAVKRALTNLLDMETVSGISIGTKQYRKNIYDINLSGELWNTSIINHYISGDMENLSLSGNLLDSTLDISTIENSTLHLKGNNYLVKVDKLGNEQFNESKDNLHDVNVHSSNGNAYLKINKCNNSLLEISSMNNSNLQSDEAEEFFLDLDADYLSGFTRDRNGSIVQVPQTHPYGHYDKIKVLLDRQIFKLNRDELTRHFSSQLSKVNEQLALVHFKRALTVDTGNNCDFELSGDFGTFSVKHGSNINVEIKDFFGINSFLALGSTAAIINSSDLINGFENSSIAKQNKLYRLPIHLSEGNFTINSIDSDLKGGIIQYREGSQVLINTEILNSTIFYGKTTNNIKFNITRGHNLSFVFVDNVDCEQLSKIEGHDTFIFNDSSSCSFGHSTNESDYLLNDISIWDLNSILYLGYLKHYQNVTQKVVYQIVKH